MTDSDNQLSVSRLTALRAAILNSGDDRTFFSLLFRYVEYICKDNQLETNAWKLFNTSYLNENDVSEFELKEGTFDKNMPDLLNDYRRNSRPYYSWLHLYNFYVIHSGIVDEATKTSFNTPNIKLPQVQLITQILQYEMRNTKFVQDFNSNPDLKRSDFSLYLEVFHQDFVEWLNVNSKDTPENLIELELTFEDIYPIVINKQAGVKYRLPRVNTDNRPYKIIHWCLENKDGAFVTSQMLSKHVALGKNGLVDDLHKSIFNVAKGDLRHFITKANPREITISSKTHLTPELVKELELRSEVIPISE